MTGFLVFGLSSESFEICICTNSYFEYSARQLIGLQCHFIQYSASMLVPVPKHVSFTRLKISSLLHVSEIYLPQYTTFSSTQLISTSTRSVSIEIQSSFLLSPNESLSFLDPCVDNVFDNPADRKVSGIQLSPPVLHRCLF